ncbi:MAG: putative ABC transport system permease protein [Pseudohongiellaceae bacterium]|jgi:putative ABC transport system permease protein
MMPMAAGIVWGVASVFVLVAVARGFETTQRQSLEALGDSFMLLRVNRATTNRGDSRANAFVRLEGEDMVAAVAGSPSVESLSPKANNWFISAYRGSSRSRVTAVGVEPQYADIVNVPLTEGSRWIDSLDIEQELPVCVLGPGTYDELFDGEPWQGQELQLVFSRDADEDTVVRRLKVIGVLTDEELASDEIYTSHRRVVLIPFTTWERFSPRGFQFFVVRPKTPELKDQALAELRGVLGRRHGFDPENANTLIPYFDAIDRGAQIDAVFNGLEIFLGAVGALILLLGAVGVANVVLMSVAARTFEFGLRRALGCKRRWIFAQVFLEASGVCLVSGGLGFALGLGGVEIMSNIELPEGFSAPQAELSAAWLPGALLLVVSLGAAAWPAGRAARIPVVEALGGGKL